jgi:anti-sigma regulatory factor (Ser/Thr protein kinase)
MPDPGSACADGRRFVAECLRRWNMPRRTADVAVLLTSELIANAVRHGPPAGFLQVEATHDRVRIEVSDSSSVPPAIITPGAAAVGGRGLVLIDRLSARWGWTPQPPGKTVWCEITDDSARWDS